MNPFNKNQHLLLLTNHKDSYHQILNTVGQYVNEQIPVNPKPLKIMIMTKRNKIQVESVSNKNIPNINEVIADPEYRREYYFG